MLYYLPMRARIFTIWLILFILGSMVAPLFALSNGKRPHHFVYGNAIIVGASFLVIALGLNPNNIYIVIAYGVGLGLILDEFPHWIGDVKELTRNVPIIPGAIPAVVVSELFLIVLIVLRSLKIL